MFTREALEMNIISLLNFEDGIKDECGLTWYGNDRTTADDKKFGTKSLYFSGQTIYCPISSIAPMYNQKDFSIGWWQRITGTDHYAGVVSSGFRGMILCYFNTYSITNINTFIIGNGNYWVNNGFNINLDTSQWHHFLFSKSKNKLRSYFDGKLIHSQNYPGYNIGFDTNLIIGQWDTHRSTGYMDNFFISSEPMLGREFDYTKPFKKIEKNNLILQEKENMYAKID